METDRQPDPQPPSRSQMLMPGLAVVAVAAAALLAAFMTKHQDRQAPEQVAATAPPPAREVVRAPPLTRPHAATQAMGAAPACAHCGVVESVAVAKPDKGFQMRIRMDDGSLRTVEQRGALAAGTRVVVDGGMVKLMPGPG